MRYAKQKIDLKLPWNISHTNYAGGNQLLRKSIEIPVSGRIKNITVKLSYSSWVVEGACLLRFGTTADPPGILHYYDLLEAMTLTDAITKIDIIDPAFVWYVGTSSTELRMKKKGMIDIHAGELLYFDFYADFASDPSAGVMYVDIIVELDVFALNSYGSSVPPKKQPFVSTYIGGQLDSDQRYQIFFPSDGKIGNLRITCFKGWLGSLETLQLTHKLNTDDLVVDEIDMDSDELGVILTGSQASPNYLMQSSYSFKTMRVRKDQALYIQNDQSDSSEIAFLISYNYIPQPKNKLDLRREINWIDGSEDEVIYQIPYDIYAYGISFDWLAAGGEFQNTIQIYMFKPPYDDSFGTGTVKGLFQVNTQQLPNQIDSVEIGITGQGGTDIIGTGSGGAEIMDYLPAGTILFFDITGALAPGEKIDFAWELVSHSEMYGKYFGSDVFEGINVINQINGEVIQES